MAMQRYAEPPAMICTLINPAHRPLEQELTTELQLLRVSKPVLELIKNHRSEIASSAALAALAVKEEKMQIKNSKEADMGQTALDAVKNRIKSRHAVNARLEQTAHSTAKNVEKLLKDESRLAQKVGSASAAGSHNRSPVIRVPTSVHEIKSKLFEKVESSEQLREVVARQQQLLNALRRERDELVSKMTSASSLIGGDSATSSSDASLQQFRVPSSTGGPVIKRPHEASRSRRTDFAVRFPPLSSPPDASPLVASGRKLAQRVLPKSPLPQKPHPPSVSRFSSSQQLVVAGIQSPRTNKVRARGGERRGRPSKSNGIRILDKF